MSKRSRSKIVQVRFQITFFFVNVFNLGQFREIFIICQQLPTPVIKVRIYTNEHVTQMICEGAHYISFLLNRFSVKYRFLFPTLPLLPSNHLALLNNILPETCNGKTRANSGHIALPLRGYCTPHQFCDCLCLFLKNYNTLVTSKVCFL